jgi:hypothetical protein
MTKSQISFLLIAALGLAPCSHAASTAPAATEPGRVDVVFVAPANFTDVGGRYAGPRRDALFRDLAAHLERRAGNRLDAGQSLTVAITDIDMAGEIEWWRMPRAQDVRFVRDVYPPRIELAFTLRRADGGVLREGRRELSDLMFLARVPSHPGDPLRFEKALLDEWVERQLQPPRR